MELEPPFALRSTITTYFNDLTNVTETYINIPKMWSTCWT